MKKNKRQMKKNNRLPLFEEFSHNKGVSMNEKYKKKDAINDLESINRHHIALDSEVRFIDDKKIDGFKTLKFELESEDRSDRLEIFLYIEDGYYFGTLVKVGNEENMFKSTMAALIFAHMEFGDIEPDELDEWEDWEEPVTDLVRPTF